MPGFVNVTGWSSRDIQRLGHEDDDTQPVKKGRTKYPTYNYQAEDVWAASCQAHGINKGYIKVATDTIPKTNRQIVDELLTDPSQITFDNRELGKTMRKFYQGYTFKVLKGIKLSEFDNDVMVLSNRDNITSNFELAVITSLPSSYERAVKRNDVDQRIKFATGGKVGAIGQKVKVTVEVLRKVFSQQWGTHYVTGITSEDQVVFFAYNHKAEVGDIYTFEGTVKAHRDNSTQLNRVKIV